MNFVANKATNLNFLVILNQKTGKLTIREGSLLNLEIPKRWQKADTDTKNPALWVCHLPENSWGITMISFYSTELEVKKKVPNQNNPLTYRGNLEITSENEEQIFYHCQLKPVEEEKKMSAGTAVLLWFIIVVGVLFLIASLSSSG